MEVYFLIGVVWCGSWASPLARWLARGRSLLFAAVSAYMNYGDMSRFRPVPVTGDAHDVFAHDVLVEAR